MQFTYIHPCFKSNPDGCTGPGIYFKDLWDIIPLVHSYIKIGTAYPFKLFKHITYNRNNCRFMNGGAATTASAMNRVIAGLL